MLGRVMPEAPAPDAPVQTVVVQQDDEAITVDIPTMPAGFLWTGERLMRLLPGKDEDEPMQEITLAFDNFYIYNWARDDTNSFQALARLHQPRGGIVEWAFDMKALASPSDTLKELQDKSISLSTGKAVGEHVRAYLMACVHKVKAEADELRTAKSFGWRDDKQGFLLSDHFHHVDGTLRKVLLGGNAHAKASMLAVKRGTLQGYADAVDFVYNRPGMEPMQYAFCNAFGSCLTPFSGELLYNGVLFAITGGRTARGKTTVCTAALYAFGDAAQMTHAKSTTLNARYGLMSTHGNLPILFDEFTDIEPKELSAWAYSTSEGREKGRMTVANGGVVMAEAGQWQLSPYVTANTDLRARLAQFRGNTQAESVRLVQIHIDKYPLPILNENDVSAALATMAGNMGHAGEAFVSYVVNNLPAVKAQMEILADKVSKIIPGTAYRNYRAHMVCTLGAAQILCGLGVIKFNFEKLCKFAAKLMRDMCVEVETVSVVDDQDQLVALINGLSPRIASTVGYADTGIGIEEVRIYDGVAGRYIRGGSRTDPKYAGKLYLSIKEVGAWCIGNRSTLAEIVAAARAAGALVSEFEKFNLTSGTTVINAPVPCIVLDTLKLGGEEVLPPIASVATGT
jgi:hypothetical protein